MNKLLRFFLTIGIILLSSISVHAQCGGGDNNNGKGSGAEQTDPNPSGETDVDVQDPSDPNEIIGTKGYDALGDTLQWVAATASLPYTIYFENDPELATAAAQKVEIRHALHPKADISTFAVGAFGFGSHVFTVEGNRSTYQQRLDLTADMGIYVDVVAGIDIVANEVFWIFQSIDPATGLPPQGTQEGFLPVNDENHSGEGYVSFTIKPKANACVTGDVVTASASIIFDINEAIPTNVWHNTVDALPPTTQLTGQEGFGNEVLLQFSGSDDEGGCGIKQYKLYVSDNYGAYSLYDTYPVGSEATFPTEYDHCYRFFCLGEDNVGNVEEMKAAAEYEYGNYNLMVTVSAFPEEGGMVSGEGLYAYSSQVTVTAVAAPDYEFYRWTLNGVPVSEEPTYTFSLMEEMNLVAQFVETASISQTNLLAEGWNWWSTCIELNSIDGLGMLENSLGNNGIRIQSKNEGAVDQFEYNGTFDWYGSLDAIENEQMYKIRTNAECSVVMTGHLVRLEDHPITINEGWNWIGFPSMQSISVENALGDFEPETEDIIKGRTSSLTYVSIGTYNGWYGTLNMLEPGQGYMYKSNSSTPKTLVFQNGRGEEQLKPNITPEVNVFVPAVENYADNMLITAVIELDGEELRSEDYELAAFVGDECRGSVKLMYVEPFDIYVAFLLAFGEASEEMYFVLTDGNDVSLSDDLVRYETDGTVGTLTEPVTLHFGTLGLEDNLQLPVHIYPNPSKGVFNVEGVGIQKVEVVDTFGQVILSEEVKNDYLQINLGDKAAGAYLLRVVTDKGVATKKLVLMR